MKRSFLVLILMFIATPPAFAEQDRCPCFNDLQIAGTCSRADTTTKILTGSDAEIWCAVYTGSDPYTRWEFRADAANPPSCSVTIDLTPGGLPGRRRINVITNTATPEQLADCVGQIISADEMLN